VTGIFVKRTSSSVQGQERREADNQKRKKKQTPKQAHTQRDTTPKHIINE
jgi:hypothetical protein